MEFIFNQTVRVAEMVDAPGEFAVELIIPGKREGFSVSGLKEEKLVVIVKSDRKTDRFEFKIKKGRWLEKTIQICLE